MTKDRSTRIALPDGPRLTIYHCHWPTLVVENNGTGTRIGSGKCCVNQYRNPIASWPLTQEFVEQLCEALNDYAE